VQTRNGQYFAAVLEAPGEVRFERRMVRAPKKDEVLVRTLRSGISHGTETALWRGLSATQRLDWDPRRRLFTGKRDRPGPVHPGYETVGRVEKLGGTATGIRVGDLVYLDRPHAQFHCVSDREALAGFLPSGTDPDIATFSALTRVALGAVHDSDMKVGSTVLVVGLGAVGLLVGQLCLAAGAADVFGADLFTQRMELAASFGIMPVCPREDETLASWVKTQAVPEGADTVIEASGTYEGLAQAIRACRTGGRVVAVSTYRDMPAVLPLGEEFHRNRLTLVASTSMGYGGNPVAQYPIWTFERLRQTAIDLLVTGKIEVKSLITHRLPFENLQDAYEMLDTAPYSTVKTILDYSEEHHAS